MRSLASAFSIPSLTLWSRSKYNHLGNPLVKLISFMSIKRDSNMKGAIFYMPNKPLKLENLPLPEITDSEILVKVKRCNICHTDVAIWRGEYSPRKRPPIILGHEIVGEVEEIGEKVRGFRKGDRIAISPLISCGKCFYCKMGKDNLCDFLKTIGIDTDGGFREFINLPSENAFKIPGQVSYEEAALLEPLSICHNAIEKAEIESENFVVLIGIGGLGMISLQILSRLKKANVIAVDVNDEKLEIAENFGASYKINPNRDDLIDAVYSITNGKGADRVIEMVGNKDAQEKAIKCARKGGKVIIVGAGSHSIPVEVKRFFKEEIEVTGVYICPKKEYKKLIKLIESKKLDLKALITHEFKMDDINQAFKTASGEAYDNKIPIRVSIVM